MLLLCLGWIESGSEDESCPEQRQASLRIDSFTVTLKLDKMLRSHIKLGTGGIGKYGDRDLLTGTGA